MTSRSRAALGLLAAAMLCTALAMWLRSPSEPDPLAREASGSGAESAPPATDAPAAAEAAPAARSTATNESATVAPPSGETPPLSRHLRGTLRYFDPLGAHRPVAHGAFRLHSDSEDESRTIPVEQGLWQADVPDDAFELSVFVADGAPAFLHASNHGSFAFPADGTLDLLVRRDRGCRLVVVDAESGRELRDVEVVQDRGRGQWGKQSPANSPDEVRIAEHAPSPIELDLEDGTAQYFVRSPGYAWRFASVQRSACGDYLVALRPGGDLTVTLAGAPVPDGDVLARTVAAVEAAAVQRRPELDALGRVQRGEDLRHEQPLPRLPERGAGDGDLSRGQRDAARREIVVVRRSAEAPFTSAR